jgi:transposase
MPTPRKESEEELVIKLLKKGKSAAYAAERAGVHPTTAQRWAKKHEIELSYPFNRHATRDDLVDVKEIIRLRKRKASRKSDKPLFTLQEIAELCGCSRSYVKQVLAKAREEGRL